MMDEKGPEWKVLNVCHCYAGPDVAAKILSLTTGGPIGQLCFICILHRRAALAQNPQSGSPLRLD